MITIKDIAKMCNVTKSTVSRAINNQNWISPITKSKILKVVKKLNYQPNILASALKTKRTKIIGVIIPDIINPFFSELVQCMEEELNNKEYNLILCITENKLEKEREYILLLLQHKVEGIVMMLTKDEYYKQTMKYIMQLKKNKIPFVILRNMKEIKCDYISTNDIKSGEILAEHLIRTGCKKIVFIHSDDSTPNTVFKKFIHFSYTERITGIKKVTGKIPILMSFNEFMNEGINYIKNKHNNVAIVAENDFLAMRIWKELIVRNIKIPENVSLSGFDNVKLATELGFSLTTIVNPYKKMAKKSVEFLLNRIKYPMTKQQKFIFNPELIIRNSTKPIN